MRVASTPRIAAGKPLYGVPFAIKDNIDLAGHADDGRAARAFAYDARRIRDGRPASRRCRRDPDRQDQSRPVRHRPGRHALALRRARRARFDRDYISGGSSSGSAVAVAAGLVSFALGTDTAGSGRVPAAFNNIVGLKPTRGLLSTRGVVPACRSLDCVSIFALTADDARDVLAVAKGFDAADPFSRPEPATSGRPCRANCQRRALRRAAARAARIFRQREGERLFGAMLQRIDRLGGEARRDRLRAFPRDGAPALRRALGRGALRRDPRILRYAGRTRCTRSPGRSSAAGRSRSPPTPLPPITA